MKQNWTPESWKQCEARQMPAYPDPAALDRATATLGNYPPLVFAGEARNLTADLAKVVDGSSQAHTRVVGTPLYMAPELAKGSRKAPPSSDLFSLGLIAFELLTGALPFKVPAVVAIWEGKPLKIQRLSELRPDLPVQLTTLLDRCLDIDPANRPTIAELIAAIP